MLPQGCAKSVLCRLRHCPFFFPLFGNIVVASVLTQSARDLTY